MKTPTPVELRDAANDAADQLGQELPEPTAEPDEVLSLDQQLDLAWRAQQGFEKLREELEKNAVDIESRLNDLAASENELSSRSAEFEKLRSAYDSRLAQIEQRELDLASKQAEAEAGFLGRREEILAPIRERIIELSDSWHAQERQLLEQWEQQLRDRRAEITTQLVPEREELDRQAEELAEQRSELSRKQSELERIRRELDVEAEILAEDRAEHVRNVEAMNARVAQAVERARRDSEEEHQRLLQQNSRLEAAARRLRQIEKDFHGDPAEVLARVEELESECELLRDELRSRPGASVEDELDEARSGLRQALAQRDEAHRSVVDLEGRLNRVIADQEKTTQLELTNDALLSTIEAYKQEIRQMRSDLDDLKASTSAQTAFPECRKMDRLSGGSGRVKTQSPEALDEFIEDLQIRMSYDKQTRSEGRRLNYRLSDLRLFLAGMAMSRLHLLEGVSGTGKTTLPRAFATAIGAGWKAIEVQAGWRDRQDLLGYYNSFERVYRESECLQWLYKAQLPPFIDMPIFIILDEMNLSHPEQYFADFLSVLENPTSPISLIDRSVPDPPEQMVTDAGVQLRMPQNVWFVGTANQDETTFGFAPKTYDRAHVMNLQPDAPDVTGKEPEPRADPVSLSGLQKAFDDAGLRHASDSQRAKEFVSSLEVTFNENFRVGWGHRLNKHIDRFVPVDIAAGGSLGEALDHIVATKLMKKIAGRHSLRRESLEALRDDIEGLWPDRSNPPEATRKAIADELHNLNFG